MLTRRIYLARQLAALLVTASGLWQVAGLWFGRLDEAAVFTAFTGSVYLFVGLGLFGHSRLSLVLAVLLPATLWWLSLAGVSPWGPDGALRAASDALIVLLSARVVWALRHQPSL
jgi:hypothetical protein